MTTSNWREDFYERFPNIWMEGPKGTYTTIDQWVLAFIEKEIEAAKQEERDAIVEAVEKLSFEDDHGCCGNREIILKDDLLSTLQTSNKNN